MVVLAAQALAMAPGAQAATGTLVNRSLDTYTVFAQDGKANAIQISRVVDGNGTDFIVVEDAGDIVIAGNDCTTVTPHRVE